MHKRKTVLPIAESIVEDIKEFCDLIHIGGSLRREVSMVKDIEIIALPKSRGIRNKMGYYFMKRGKVLKGGFGGRYVQVMVDGIQVDLFLPQRHDYWRMLVIRTGSARFSKEFAKAWVKRGFKGTKEGLVYKHDGTVIEFESEQHVFDVVGMRYIEPQKRL